MDYLLQLQYVTEPLYELMTGFFADSRAELSVLLTGLNDEGVDEITEGEEILENRVKITFPRLHTQVFVRSSTSVH